MHQDNLAIVTGTSSGIGLALARALLDKKWRVLGLARRLAPIADERYTHLTVDLSDLAGLRNLARERLVPALEDPAAKRVALVNNAALIGARSWLRLADPVHLGQVFTVNAAAPLYLMGLVAGVVPPSVRLRIVNISSGAAHLPLPGLADYGASKAALRLAGQTLAAELERSDRLPRDAAVFSYEPGLVDTAMQDQARSAPAEAFPALETFQRFADEGQLNAPEEVVKEILVFLDSDPAENFIERRFGEA